MAPPIHPVNLYFPPLEPDVTAPPTWRELAHTTFSPRAMRDLQRRRELGMHDAPPDVKTRLACADAMFFAQANTVNRLFPSDHLYAEAIEMLNLPIGNAENVDSCFHLQDKYSDFLQDAILKLIELHDRVTNGMTMVSFLRPDSRLRAPQPPAEALVSRTAFYVTPRFVDNSPHSLHTPLHASFDTFTHTYGPIVKAAYVDALSNHSGSTTPVPRFDSGPCHWLPMPKALSGYFELPYPAENNWRLVYVPDMTAFPEDVFDHIVVPGVPDADLAFTAQRLRRENSDLRAQLARFYERLQPRHDIIAFTIEEECARLEEEVLTLSDSHDKLVELMRAYVAVAIVPNMNILHPSENRTIFDRFLSPLYIDSAMPGVGAWYVHRNKYDDLKSEIHRMRSGYQELRHRLDEEKETSQRYLERKELALARCRTYLTYTDHSSTYGKVRDDLPLVHISEWARVIGPRTTTYLYSHSLLWMTRYIYAAVASLPPNEWSAYLQDQMRDGDSEMLSPNLLLVVGADLIHAKIGAYEAKL
ncbi:hypothetical protein FISHEDRAFT_70031 [Fistulina hepatica ATCC 64428]|uniref:Uncharacterized protein n=1 Tax=Fistulina hepatica ATCC 64428 TaxID=1128425 RepID=A0A0D7AM25_9AGAR|nr:hypothetical protein FISHEDRAFT_70031 [Fistulina hepatica ATCC 64428]